MNAFFVFLMHIQGKIIITFLFDKDVNENVAF